VFSNGCNLYDITFYATHDSIAFVRKYYNPKIMVALYIVNGFGFRLENLFSDPLGLGQKKAEGSKAGELRGRSLVYKLSNIAYRKSFFIAVKGKGYFFDRINRIVRILKSFYGSRKKP
jgi:hypothetical protein